MKEHYYYQAVGGRTHTEQGRKYDLYNVYDSRRIEKDDATGHHCVQTGLTLAEAIEFCARLNRPEPTNVPETKARKE